MAIWNVLVGYVVPFYVVITVLVFIHELGHYLVARRCGVRVEVFSIGFGRELWGFNDRAGTRWKFAAIPFGGYVKMFGESDSAPSAEEDRGLTPAEKAVAFNHKSLRARAAIVAAGPIANFLLAIVLIGGLYALAGQPMSSAAIGTVMDGSPAAAAGLKPGDKVIEADGRPVAWFEDLRTYVMQNPDRDVRLTVERAGEQRMLTVRPRAVVQGDGATVGQLGVTPDPAQVSYRRHDPLTATWLAVEWTVGLTGQILTYIGQIVIGSQGADQLGGPLRIAQMSGEMAAGGLLNLVVFMAALSVNLGLINLFPVPLLDGGHLVFYAAEAIRGRPLTPRAQEYGFRFGLVLVLLLMVFATWNDLVQLRVFEFLKDLVT